MRLRIILPTDAWALGAIVSLTITAHLLVARPIARARAEHDRLAMTIVQRDREVTAIRERIQATEAEHAALAERARPIPRLEPISALNDRLSALGELAEARAIKVMELRRVGERAQGNLYTITLRLTGAGTFRDVVRFVHDLHADEPHVSVDSVDVSGNPQSRDGLVRVALDLHWSAAPGGGAIAQVDLDEP